MYGAIFGDLAAWTYEHDMNTYEERTISSEAPLSLHGKMVQYFYRLFEHPAILETKEAYRQTIHWLEEDIKTGLVVPKPIKEFIQTGYHIQPPVLKDIMWPAAYIYCGFAAQDPHQALMIAHEWCQQLHLNKQGFYTTQLAEIIAYLKEGQNIDELPIQPGDIVFTDFLLGRFLRCFKESHNYKSAIDNAMHSEGYIHLNGIIVGALANAYYKEK